MNPTKEEVEKLLFCIDGLLYDGKISRNTHILAHNHFDVLTK